MTRTDQSGSLLAPLGLEYSNDSNVNGHMSRNKSTFVKTALCVPVPVLKTWTRHGCELKVGALLSLRA